MDAQQANETLKDTFGSSWFWYQDNRVYFRVHPPVSTKIAKWWVELDELRDMSDENFQVEVDRMQSLFEKER
ncbi:MAG TPA: hypothetical protein VKA48_13005 [Gammaproteobacteria bacterium]|nr:hypothetical protein [Gammaproteobacteria bacterium]